MTFNDDEVLTIGHIRTAARIASRDLFDVDGQKHDRMGTLLGDGVIEEGATFENTPFDLDIALWFRMVIPLIMKG